MERILSKLLFFIASLFSIPSSYAQPESLVLATHSRVSGEYIHRTEQELQATKVVLCVLANLGVKSEILMLPWARAKRELERGNIDGVFFTSPSEVTQSLRSQPVTLEHWYRYQKKNPGQAAYDRLGVVRGSDIEHWLIEQGQEPYMQAPDLHQLLAQFAGDRFDYFVADRNRVSLLLAGSDVDIAHSFVRFAAKTVSFSLEVARLHPDFMTQFNRQISHCNPRVTRLSESQQNTAVNFVANDVIAALPEQFLPRAAKYLSEHRPMSEAAIVQTETLWAQELASQEYHLIGDILGNPLSQVLTAMEAQADVIREIMLTTENGELLAMSRPTSDYWQGDESKITGLSGRHFRVSALKFDDSVSEFLAHVSYRLPTQQGSGVLIVGLQIEKLLLNTPKINTP
ncbi:hypothetical protein [Lacimicrobium alkaliphilum]|uniref:Solute-binding protein family 3/N-terminal domain-containing protein n=1 Tax=Lacimicrobium alkaliphilum TaxID=1526571 RepID=A0ABQ1R3U0_9ALTE|nr:hypothetical protein [Lacimicrobium alkaliphilum]GGD57195.1 hypothetical protein GCM10011357_10830 [Lacimicrobium alkaliphilum]